VRVTRTLLLRKEILTDLSASELEAVAGAGEVPTLRACFEIGSMPLYSCLFVCTEA
jgi:hypothetical protein